MSDDSSLRAHYVLHRSCRGKAHASGIGKHANNRQPIYAHPEKIIERANKGGEELTSNSRNDILRKCSRNSTSFWDCSDSDSMNSLEASKNRVSSSIKNTTTPSRVVLAMHSSRASRNMIGNSSKKRESWADTLRGGLVDDRIKRMEEGWDDSNVIKLPRERKWRMITAEIQDKLPNSREILTLRGAGSNIAVKNRINHSAKKIIKRNRNSIVHRPVKPPIYDVVEWEELLEMALAKKMARGGSSRGGCPGYKKEDRKKGLEEPRETDYFKRLEVLLQNRMTPLNLGVGNFQIFDANTFYFEQFLAKY